MSLSSVTADIRNDQSNENEFENLNQENLSKKNNLNLFLTNSSIEKINCKEDLIGAENELENLDSGSEKAFSLNRDDQKILHSIVDQNNNEFFNSGKQITDLNNNIILNEDDKKHDITTNQSNLTLHQSLNQIVNGLNNSFAPTSTISNDDLISSQISYLNSTNSSSSKNSNSSESVDSQNRRALTGAHNFNNTITASRSPTSLSQNSPQQQNNALFKSYNNLKWPTGQNSNSAWSNNNSGVLNQSTNQQNSSVNTWNVFNNSMNSLSGLKQSSIQNLANSNISSNLISSIKKTNQQLPNSTCGSTQTHLNSNQQHGQLSPLSPKFRQNRPPLMNTNTLNAMLMMQNMDINNNTPSPLDTFHTPLERQILEMMCSSDRQNNDLLRGKCSPGSTVDCGLNSRSISRRRGKSPFFTNSDQDLLSGLDSSNQSESTERFSRKVFVGGLPPDIDEEEIKVSFRRFGSLAVDWPHKAESKSYFPPKGYAFLLFQDEASVQALIEVCIADADKLYLCVSSPTIKDKPVQIRPWRLSDADFVLDASMPLDPRKTVFVGGVPRPLKAIELAMIMDRLYGGVCYAGIDTDPELKYPKGAGRVAFSNQQSYIAAISARFVQLQHADIEKRVEVKPYVLDDQICDECSGSRCGGKFAPFFCANVTCLQYYCEQCWAQIHTRPGREFHKPLVKEGADRPRPVPFKFKKII